MLPDDDSSSVFSPSLIKLGRSLAIASSTFVHPSPSTSYSAATAAVATTPAAADLSKVHKLCIVTLLRILDNIINDINTPPERKNARIRKIKTTGPFHDRAGQWEGSIEFLLECGFQRTTNSQLKLMEDNPSRLLAGRKELVRFAVEQLGLLESKLPDCPVLDEIVAPTNPNSPAIEDAVALGTEDNNACEITKSYADRSDTEYDGNQSNACLSLESSSGGVNVAVVNDSGLSTENGDGQHVIQSSKDEITPTHQHQQQDEQLPRNQLPQDPTVQQIPDDVPSQSNISASDSMSSLLDEIEMELNGDSSFFLGDYSGEHHHEEILGDGEIASSSSIAEGLPEHAQMQLETLFAADVCFMDEFSLARTHIMPEEEDNEDTLPAELDESKEQVHLLDNSNNVRLEQTKHVESEDGTDVNANRTIVPIARDDDHIALILPEVVEEMLLLQQPNNEITIPPPESCRGHVDSTTTSETAPIDKETADIVHFHGRNKSASDLLIYLDSENETGNGVDNTTDITSSFPLQQEHRYGDDDIGLNGNEQSMSEFDRAPSDGADSTLRHQNDLIDEDHADLNTPPPGSLSDDSDMYTYYRSLFNRISPPEGEFSFANENDDIMQYRHGFELCHRALFSVWVESIRRTDASKYKISGRSKHVDPLAGLTNLLLHKRSEMDQDCSAEGKSLLGYVSSERPILLVPLDVAYASWACILDLNSDDESNNNDFRISSDGSAAGKMYSWIVSNHRHLCVVDDNIPPAQESMLPKRARSRLENICNFVCKSLRDIGLISLFSANISVGMSDDSTLYIGVEGFESKDNIPRNRDEIVPKWDDRSMLSKCHSILSRLVYPTLLDELDFVNQSDISRVSTYGVLCWYSCHFLVDHLIESGQLTTARSLLSDTRFIRLRVNYLGCFSGASIHCRDCSRLAHCLSRSQKNNHFAEDSWREPSPSSNAEGFEDGKSILTDNHKAGIAGWSEYHFKILCSVSAVLRGRVETLSQEENEARMDIGQSMKIIGECIGEIGPYYVQEMEHYEEAFRLLTEAYGQDQNHEAIADILYVMGCHHQRFNHYKFAQKCYEQSLRIYKVTVGSEHTSVAQVLRNIGIIYHASANNITALKCFNKSLSILLPLLSQNELSVADSYCWIGKIHREEKRFSNAHECFVAAHQIKVSLLGVDHIESAGVLHNIGIVCDDLGLSSQSLSCFRKVLFIRLAAVSGAHDVRGINDVCETLDCIANVYRTIGESEKALLFFEQCLKRRVRIVQVDKGQVALLLRTYEDVLTLTRALAKQNNDDQSLKLGSLLVEIGTLYDHQLNKHSRALTSLQKALQMFKQGKDLKNIGTTLSLIGVLHVKKSAFQKALKCFHDSLVMQKITSESKDTAQIADTLHNIGNCEARLGHFEESIPAFEEAMRIKKTIYPLVHLSISRTEHCAGLVMSQLGKLDEALTLFQSSLNTRRSLLGNDDLDVSFSLHSLGKIYFFQNKVDDAITYLEEALKIKKSKLPEMHMSVAESLHLLGTLYVQKGTCAPAIPLLNSALVAYRGKKDCEIIKSDVLDLLGHAYAKIGDTDGALLSYEHSLKIKQSIVGKETIPCANVLLEIGRLKSLKNDYDGALAAFKEVKTIHKQFYGKNHVKNADLLIQVGLIQERLDNDDLALRCFVEALKIRRKLLEKNHRDIAAATVCVGRVHQAISDHVKAITLFQDAIKIYEESDGDVVSSECGSAFRLLGLSQTAIGESDSAVASLEFCVDCRARIFGTESKEWAEAAYSLGVAKSEAGLHDDAISLFEEFVLRQKSFDDSDLQSLANAMLSLGKIYANKRKVENAMACFDEAFGFMQQACNDQGSSEVLFQIGSLRESKKQYLESLECYEKSLKLRIAAVGEDEVTADIVSRIGELHRIRGHYDLAMDKFTLALDMYKCAIGETHLSVANTYHSLGYVCDAMDDVPKSMQNHKEGLSVRKLILGANHVLIASSLDDIAGMYQKQNEHQKALKCLKEALRIRRLQLHDDDIEISKTLFGMGIIFAAINDNENATECYKTSLEISSRTGSHPKLEAQTLHQIGCLEAAKCNYREALHNWRTCLSKYRESGLRDDHYMVACTLGNIEMAENVLRT